MEHFFTIKQAAKKINMTSETLRHYDRIGLVQPYKDKKTGYRYYSEQDLIQLQTIELLKTMDLTLMEIKNILEENQLNRIIALLKQAEKKADEKIINLQNAKKRIKRAYTDYENKLAKANVQNEEFFVSYLSERIIMLSDNLAYPTTDNLFHYHKYFYEQVDEEVRSQFLFEDSAGIYTDTTSTKKQMFAVCLHYPSLEGLTILPAGNYLCANCTEENKERVIQKLLQQAQTEFAVHPDVVLQFVVITGILQWNYQIQILIR